MIDYLLMRKLGAVRMSLLKRGKVRQVILMSPELSTTEKAILYRYFKENK